MTDVPCETIADVRVELIGGSYYGRLSIPGRHVELLGPWKTLPVLMQNLADRLAETRRKA